MAGKKSKGLATAKVPGCSPEVKNIVAIAKERIGY